MEVVRQGHRLSGVIVLIKSGPAVIGADRGITFVRNLHTLRQSFWMLFTKTLQKLGQPACWEMPKCTDRHFTALILHLHNYLIEMRRRFLQIRYAVMIHIMLISPCLQEQILFLIPCNIYNTTTRAYLNHVCYVTISITSLPTHYFFSDRLA